MSSYTRRLPATRARAALAVACAVALGVAGCREEAPPPPPPGPVPVTVVTLKSSPVLLTRELPGRTSAYLVAEVRPQASGLIKRRLFTEGGAVKQGDTLYELDDATYRADYASAKAVLERAQAHRAAAELDAKRAAELGKQQAISAQEQERATSAFLLAQADVKAAEASVQRAALMLGYARITAPISGRIGKSSVTQGALVTANQPQPLVLVQQLDPIYVDLTQSSAELLQLRKEVEAGALQKTDSAPVTILLEDGTEYEHEGKLTFADVTVNPGTGSFLLRVVVPNPDQTLLPGMYVRARVGRGLRQDAVLVAQQAVARDPKGNTTAWVVGADSKVELREVKVSRTIGDQWLVDEGLKAGERVVVEGVQKIGPGALVQATEAAVATPADGAGAGNGGSGATAAPEAAPAK